MIRRVVRHLYEWTGQPGQETLEPAGQISEAKLRAWEYRTDDRRWTFVAGRFEETVRLWKTARPDLRVPDLWVGDLEEVDASTDSH